MPVKITFLSRDAASKDYSPLDPTFSKDVKDAIAKQLFGHMNIYVKDKGTKLGLAIERAANRKLAEVARFIAREVIGFPTAWVAPGGAPEYTELDVDGHVGPAWLALSAQYLVSKKKNNNKHYLHKGDLRRAVAASGPAIAKIGGIRAVVTIAKKDSDERVIKNIRRVGQVEIFYAPAAKAAGLLPGLTSGNPLGSIDKSLAFERRLGFSPETMEKLVGPGGGYIHRPLIQPVVSYWLLYRVPQEIGRVMSGFAKRSTGVKGYATQGGRV